MLEPLYTAEEMRAAEEGHDVEELMRRAGAAVAEEVLRRFLGSPVVRGGLRRREPTAATVGSQPSSFAQPAGRSARSARPTS